MNLIKDDISRLNNVVAVSTSNNLPNDIPYFSRPDWFCEDVVNCVPISYNSVDYDFVDLYNIELRQGRNFSRDYPSDENGAFIVNEAAVKMMIEGESNIDCDENCKDCDVGKILFFNRE